MSPDGASSSPSPDAATPDAPPGPPFVFGMTEWPSEFVPYAAFRAAAGTPAGVPRLCHIYTYWDIAHHDPAGAGDTHTLAGITNWLAMAEGKCDEVMITFQGPQQPTPADPPAVATFEQSFVDFQNLPALANWNGKLSYTAWNEPNNQANSGNGLQKPITPELAAQYYLALRKHCAPPTCKVAAGDFATNGNTAADIAWNCANDNDPANTTTRCAQPSSLNPANAPPSYLDRYKNYLALHATDVGLPANFRPEYLAYHPWHDVNSYIDSNAPCSTYQNCATRRLLQSLGGTWGGVEIWDNEIGVGLQNSTPPDAQTTQPCGAAFLVRLTELSPRITRLYYMRFGAGNGPLLDGQALRPAGQVLANYSPLYAGARCADTGIPREYSNPVIPMFGRPPGAPSGPGSAITEGCPDPSGIKTRAGDFYIYCTSYTFPYSRQDGFPIFKAPELAGNPWTRAGSIIPDSGAARTSWPGWIRDGNGTRFGLFWAPDVRELPNGKFVATYAAPCGDTQCVGMAWADGPAGPWTHKTDAPFLSSANNGAGLGGPGHRTYDPNVLSASDGSLYLYWVVAGSGIWGARVTAAASGALSLSSAPTRLMDQGEGPYMIEHAGVFYLFYSTNPSGGLTYDYQLHVRRAAGPLAAFTEEGPLVIHKSAAANGSPVSATGFVAPGGNSVIQNAAGGVDFMIYHAIKVPAGTACPAVDPENGQAITGDPVHNPYCRTQGERQAMIDPITWTPDGWPAVGDGTPSTSARLVP